MRITGNLLWWLFGGLEAAIGYICRGLRLCKHHCFNTNRDISGFILSL